VVKIALISDIHSNLTALEAVVKDIRRRRIQRVICLGDVVGKGPQPAESVDRIRELCEVTLQGNWDHGINQPQSKDNGKWQQAELGAERLEYLNGLPFSVDLHLSGKWIRLFHASATSVYDRVNRNAPKREKLAMFEHTDMTGCPDSDQTGADGVAAAKPDIVGYGDIHVPFIQTLKNKQKKGLILLNTGSVGAPYDGIPEACYVIIEGVPDSSEPQPLSIQMVRVPYNVEEAISKAEQSGMPGLDRFRYEIVHGLKQ
jgi:protein phosphatase